MQVDQEMLFEIILAANYMDIKSWRWLQDCRKHDQGQYLHLRKTFNIQHPKRLQQGDGKPSLQARGRANPVTNPPRR
jgi:hypothetical protein